MNDSHTSPIIFRKRKRAFLVHDELRAPSVTVFEEISDIDRTTVVCETMESPSSYRPHLDHVNNQNYSWCPAVVHPVLHCIDVSNNSSVADLHKRKQLMERVLGKAVTSRTMLLDLTQIKEKSSKTKEIGIKPSQTKYKIDGLVQTSSKFDKFDEEADQRLARGGNHQAAPKFAPNPGRRDSIRPFDAKLPIMSKTGMMSRELQLGKFTLGETVEESGSDHDLATIANVHLSQREQALKLLAEIQVKIEKRHKTDDEEDTGKKTTRSITPEEALQCAWLRLSKEQVATLETLIRQQGKDPGIHAHSDVTNYDVFAEIREIRNREKVLREEDEYRKMSKGSNVLPNKPTKTEHEMADWEFNKYHRPSLPGFR